MATEDEQKSRHDFWMKVASAVFGLWAAAVLAAIGSLWEFQKQFNNYVLQMERRVILLEERQIQYQRQQIENANMLSQMLSERRNGTTQPR